MNKNSLQYFGISANYASPTESYKFFVFEIHIQIVHLLKLWNNKKNTNEFLKVKPKQFIKISPKIEKQREDVIMVLDINTITNF
jgi:hypothetical protein